MIGKKLLTVTLTTSIILTACSQSTDSLEAYYNKLDKANQKESVIVDLNKKMKSLEMKKVKKIQELNKAKGNDFNTKAKNITDGIDDREAIINKEEKALAESEKIYKSSKKEFNAIEDKDQKKEAKELKTALDKKYALHEKVISGYKNVLKAEKNLFGYLSRPNATQKEADERSKELSEQNKKVEKVVTDYQEILKKVQKEKKDVADLLDK
ncbi:YkyA family protein [Mammaliicoccus stepanovicii]|uniref:Putative lipoprotein n=1 Tax=Mammaliicoccus stepanovicii TaxID=643214 RepID=A0A239ZP99_9STAP|nr:YkyA family protein [Mammaliicoccus stepanovicii]PNZ79183.1 hypothetical protein CD111_00585 [Mammaliicoccus stepanovicii]GGI41437.1 hypothetical protein GCM10010896_13430 [Mammaliicoccus stepanovicii]SNV72668.1 putative lipoprotein [Mammaliicoccus stepanovicii]